MLQICFNLWQTERQMGKFLSLYWNSPLQIRIRFKSELTFILIDENLKIGWVNEPLLIKALFSPKYFSCKNAVE